MTRHDRHNASDVVVSAGRGDHDVAHVVPIMAGDRGPR
jgi:hypothetical protein